LGEGIDYGGDVDDFRFDVGPNELVEINAKSEGGTDLGPFNVRIAKDGSEIGHMDLYPTRGIGPFMEGAYRVRVSHDGISPADTGRYELTVNKATIGPETASPLLSGDILLDTESFDIAADVDSFLVDPLTNTEYVMGFGADAVCNAGTCAPYHVYFNPVNWWNEQFEWNISGAGLTYAAPELFPKIIKLNAAWEHELRISARGDTIAAGPALGDILSASGPYRFILRPINILPEVAASTLLLDGSDVVEAFDLLPDVDSYLINLADTSAFGISLNPQIPGPGDVHWTIEGPWDMLTDSRVVAESGAWGDTRLIVYPGIDYNIRVVNEKVDGVFTDGFMGNYVLNATPVNIKPEFISTNLLVGDSLTGETISDVFDVDEFVAQVPLDVSSLWVDFIINDTTTTDTLTVQMHHPLFPEIIRVTLSADNPAGTFRLDNWGGEERYVFYVGLGRDRYQGAYTVKVRQ